MPDAERMLPCPRCFRFIQARARECRHCGQSVPPFGREAAPEVVPVAAAAPAQPKPELVQMSVCKACGAWKPKGGLCETCPPQPMAGVHGADVVPRVNGRPYYTVRTDSFQDADEPDWIIHVEQAWPPEVATLPGYYEIAVAGISRYQRAARGFIASPQKYLVLEREPTNPKDPNAVKVHGLYAKRDGKVATELLGYVPAQDAALLATDAAGLYLHARPTLLFRARPAEEMSAGIRFEVGVSRTLDSHQASVSLS